MEPVCSMHIPYVRGSQTSRREPQAVPCISTIPELAHLISTYRQVLDEGNHIRYNKHVKRLGVPDERFQDHCQMAPYSLYSTKVGPGQK